MNKVIKKSYAKINLGLNVTAKRPDGFHDLETIFLPVSLHDELLYEKAESYLFTSNYKPLETEGTNLITRAKTALENLTGEKLNVHIDLIKHTPIGAGLGGGSSNCAVTLLTLNEMFELGVERFRLEELALSLGSDVPFFLTSRPVFARGRGEIMSPVNFEITKPVLIINPGIHVSTKMAFTGIVPGKPKYSLDKIDLTDAGLKELKNYVFNDFEPVIFEQFPEICQVKKDLYEAGAEFALMTGTGSTVFGIFDNHETAVKAEAQFNPSYFTYLHSF